MPSRLLRSLIGAALAVAVLVPAMSMGPVEPAGALTPKVLATLPVDQYAYVGAVNPVTNRLYETNGVTGELSTLDGGTLATLDTIVIGRHAGVAGVDAVRNLVFVVSYPDTGVEIDVVDGSTGAVTASIPLGADYVHDVAINPTTGKLYVLTSTLTQVDFVRDWAIAVIDESTFQVTASIPLPSMAMRIAVNPVTGKLYVLVSNSKSIMVIDGTSNEVITTLTVGPDPYDVCVNDVTNMIYVSTWFEYDPPSIPPDSIEEIPPGAIWPIDGATDHVESHIRVGRSPMSIACNTATNQVFFANESGSEVAVLDGVSRSIVGSFCDPVVAASSGTAPQDVSVVTGQGPVTGGAVSWEMQPRTAWSSKSYGLLSDGSIRFPAAPAGRVAVTIADGVLPDGTLISGKLYGVLGIGTLVLHPPPEPAASASTIHVETPSGAPLPGATVSLTGVSATRSSEGMAFTAPNAARSGVTDLNGDFRAYGFASPDAEATVSFDDGVITQQQVVALTPPTTTVTMPYNPEVQPTVTSVEARSGEAVVETLRVTGPSNQRPSARGASSPTRAGIVVRANLPKGTPVGTCGAVLSAVTNAKGKAKLRICATTSTTIGFSATGAYVVGALRLFVKGAAPTAVIDLHASTPSTGCLKVGWLPPEYTGGHPVTSYSVYVTAQGQPTVSLTTTRTSVKVKGLANATRYRVWVAARTSKGAGPGASITAPVA